MSEHLGKTLTRSSKGGVSEGVGVAQTVVEDRDTGNTVAAVNCYFMCQDGSMFKAQVRFAPYFYLQVQVRP